MGIRLIKRAVLVGSLIAGVTPLPALANEQEAFQQAQDLRYGEVLFEYHQGRSFEALSLLNVAKMKAGIQNHGDHPALVEGGLMLAYGMTREAKVRFENVLKDQVSPESRNAAWYYLGKVFYLEGDADNALVSLEKVDPDLLKTSKPDLHQEWQYLLGQLKLKAGKMGAYAFPNDALWAAYLKYNEAVTIQKDKQELGFALMSDLIINLLQRIEAQEVAPSNLDEANALIDQSRLSLSQWAMEQDDFAKALVHLKAIRFDSMLSEQSLFNYAVAATRMQEYGLALEALNTLQARESFTPWLQQIPYALAYLYEQMQELPLALQAYQAAGEHYAKRLQEVAQQSSELNEASIVGALYFKTYGEQANTQADLSAKDIRLDAYGHIDVAPIDFTFASLLSMEAFQLGLRDLHELYKLQNSMSRWESQLDSFDLMLDTRAAQRNVRVSETQAALSTQNADQWQLLQSSYAKQINTALAEEDLEFFMDEDQRDYQSQIQQAYETLWALEDDGSFLDEDDIADYKTKLDRINSYFQWWISDRYGVNRWEAEHEMRQLNTAMEEFTRRRAVLESELASNAGQAGLQTRVTEGKERLSGLQKDIDVALDKAREIVITLVREELARQSVELDQYMRASKRAEARIADVLYQASLAPDQEKQEASE